MSDKQVNVGVIGFGMSARVFHCPLIASSPYLHLAAVVERRSDKSKDIYPWITVHKSAEELFANPDIDLVVITTPNDSHYPLVLQAMQAGKHVVVEKPFTVTSEEAEELCKVARDTGCICSIYQNRRWDGDFLTVQKIVKGQQLGRLVEYESHFDRFRNYVKTGWREETDTPGSGMLYDLGAHLIDQALHLFGMPKSVFAVLCNQRQLRDTDIIDDFTIILGYENNLKAILRSSMLARHEPVFRFNLRGMQGSYRKEWLDVQEGQLKAGLVPSDADYGIEPVERYGTINSEWNGLHIVGKVDTEKGDYLAFYNNVAEAILKGDPDLLAVKPEDGANCIRIIELAHQSNDEGRTILL
ncbi:uncharacterized protein BX663DRAFT_524834 [Cokeromyces recurvatus]|uniref:uncharacterized protein n=1 Tax=Cokeromyces recurvatus TaxID=90255 RepID=UPI00221F234C|nr:uncharacterized protein BX663DRAFT_524834 [Cokeromyces recurvatus]KAI7898470.1 hypothetical protein BX663DRAFT_524834 [Cokeromyces recurvatus]